METIFSLDRDGHSEILTKLSILVPEPLYLRWDVDQDERGGTGEEAMK